MHKNKAEIKSIFNLLVDLVSSNSKCFKQCWHHEYRDEERNKQCLTCITQPNRSLSRAYERYSLVVNTGKKTGDDAEWWMLDQRHAEGWQTQRWRSAKASWRKYLLNWDLDDKEVTRQKQKREEALRPKEQHVQTLFHKWIESLLFP